MTAGKKSVVRKAKRRVRLVYMDNAATSHPKPEVIYRTSDRVLRTLGANPGRASHRMAIEALRVVFKARESVAALVRAPDSSRIAFMKNATEAINVSLKGLLRPGDHVITTDIEHNSVVKTVAGLEKTGVEATRVPADAEGFIDPARVAAAARPNTKVVVLSHASNVFGGIQDIAAISRAAHDAGALFVLDAAQTAGALPIDVVKSGVDVLCATGHKSCLGPQGTGFLYAREGVELAPLINGGTGDSDAILEMPERLESGTLNTPGIAALGAGVEFIVKKGVRAVREKEAALMAGLLRGLLKIKGLRVIGTKDAKKRVCLVSFNLDGISAAEVGRRLDEEYGFLVRTGVQCAPEAHRRAGTHPLGAVRVSPGPFTTTAELRAFVRACADIAKG